MKQLEVQKLNKETFEKYGEFHNMINPDTEILAPGQVEFHRDICRVTLGQCNQPSFSITHISRRSPVIEKLECHNFTGEAFMPLDGDAVIHLAPASRMDNVPYQKIEAFYVPKGTLIIINPGVWHQAPYAAKQEEINVLVVLPERAYQNDCYVVRFDEDKKLELVY